MTSALITLLAAGLAAQAVLFLQQAGFLDMTATVWDSSGLLADNSLAGRLLHTLIGYTDRPNGAQLAAYLADGRHHPWLDGRPAGARVSRRAVGGRDLPLLSRRVAAAGEMR